MSEAQEHIEAVAKAMAEIDSGPQGSILFDIHWQEFGAGYLESASAAIKTMRQFIDFSHSLPLTPEAATPTDSANPPPVESVGPNSEAQS